MSDSLTTLPPVEVFDPLKPQRPTADKPKRRSSTERRRKHSSHRRNSSRKRSSKKDIVDKQSSHHDDPSRHHQRNSRHSHRHHKQHMERVADPWSDDEPDVYDSDGFEFVPTTFRGQTKSLTDESLEADLHAYQPTSRPQTPPSTRHHHHQSTVDVSPMQKRASAHQSEPLRVNTRRQATPTAPDSRGKAHQSPANESRRPGSGKEEDSNDDCTEVARHFRQLSISSSLSSAEPHPNRHHSYPPRHRQPPDESPQSPSTAGVPSPVDSSAVLEAHSPPTNRRQSEGVASLFQSPEKGGHLSTLKRLREEKQQQRVGPTVSAPPTMVEPTTPQGPKPDKERRSRKVRSLDEEHRGAAEEPRPHSLSPAGKKRRSSLGEVKHSPVKGYHTPKRTSVLPDSIGHTPLTARRHSTSGKHEGGGDRGTQSIRAKCYTTDGIPTTTRGSNRVRRKDRISSETGSGRMSMVQRLRQNTSVAAVDSGPLPGRQRRHRSSGDTMGPPPTQPLEKSLSTGSVPREAGDTLLPTVSRYQMSPVKSRSSPAVMPQQSNRRIDVDKERHASSYPVLMSPSTHHTYDSPTPVSTLYPPSMNPYEAPPTDTGLRRTARVDINRIHTDSSLHYAPSNHIKPTPPPPRKLAPLDGPSFFPDPTVQQGSTISPAAAGQRWNTFDQTLGRRSPVQLASEHHLRSSPDSPRTPSTALAQEEEEVAQLNRGASSRTREDELVFTSDSDSDVAGRFADPFHYSPSSDSAAALEEQESDDDSSVNDDARYLRISQPPPLKMKELAVAALTAASSSSPLATESKLSYRSGGGSSRSSHTPKASSSGRQTLIDMKASPKSAGSRHSSIHSPFSGDVLHDHQSGEDSASRSISDMEFHVKLPSRSQVSSIHRYDVDPDMLSLSPIRGRLCDALLSSTPQGGGSDCVSPASSLDTPTTGKRLIFDPDLDGIDLFRLEDHEVEDPADILEESDMVLWRRDSGDSTRSWQHATQGGSQGSNQLQI